MTMMDVENSTDDGARDAGGFTSVERIPINQDSNVTMAERACLEHLGDDALALILEYVDLSSVMTFTSRLSHSWSQRCRSVLEDSQLATRIFVRHGFSPLEGGTSNKEVDRAILAECVRHCKLDRAFCPAKKGKYSAQNSFQLPDRCFEFSPVLPHDWETIFSEDPPPVSFDCDSFWLTSSGTSGEMLFLNPFSTQLSVWEDVLKHTTRAKPSNGGLSDEEGNKYWSSPEPKQVLFDTSDYFDINLQEYFPQSHANGFANNNDDEQEYEVSYLGVEAKPVLSTRSNSEIGEMQVKGTMLAVGRILNRDVDDFGMGRHAAVEEHPDWHSVTELVSWFRYDGEQDYGNQHVCRFRGGFHNMDVDPNRKLVFVNPWTTDDGWVLDGDLRQPLSGNEHVLVYPMMEKRQKQQHEGNDYGVEYFPNPIAMLPIREAVTDMQIAAPGDILIVSTILGNIQFWSMENPKKPRRIHSLSCHKALKAAYKRCGKQDRGENNSAVEEIFVSRHLSIEQAGFVTLQHGPDNGSSLILWKLDKEHGGWQAQAQIDLPLSASRLPQIYFDGRKIVVLGQDHIGILLLMYQVCYSNEDLDNFDHLTDEPGVQSSGGVVNFGQPCVRFSQRVRHAALGGLEPYDPVHMTCNERFIVLATKTGHFAGGSPSFFDDGHETMICSYSEGLLVVDLEKK